MNCPNINTLLWYYTTVLQNVIGRNWVKYTRNSVLFFRMAYESIVNKNYK